MILVTGAARSGTTLTTAVLRACGASIGKVNSLNENMSVREGIVKPYLRSIDADPQCQNPLPDPSRILPEEYPSWRQQVEEALAGAEVYKGAKMCLMWEIWHHHFPDARWVIVRRDRDAVVASCMRTHFMHGYHSAEGWAGWYDAHMARIEEMKAVVEYVEVWPKRFVQGDSVEMELAVEFCGYEWDEAAARACITTGNWKT